MHRALLVSDVLLYIFTYVEQLPPTIYTPSVTASPGQKCLASLAATCNAFYELAMDLLWADIYGVKLLLGCVTRLHPLVYSSLWKWGPQPAGVEPLSADEARQFLRHSTRVRSLVIELSDDGAVPLLSVIPADVCLFPRLRELRLSGSKHLELFLSHTLRDCYVYYDPEEVIPVDQLPKLSDRICLCDQLVTLSCPPLDWATWKHLSTLPTLVKIEVRSSLGAPPWLEEQHISPFLYLTSLSFTDSSAAYATTVLQHMKFPSLESFWIGVETLASTEVEPFFRALSQCKQTLETLTIMWEEYNDPQRRPLTAIPHLLSLSFTQLRSLRLRSYDSCIYLDNNVLLEVMSAWPHLQALHIEECAISPSVTFHGLLTAIRQCPQLEAFGMLIDTVNIDVDPDAEPIQHACLQTLRLETPESPTGNAEAIARIIFDWLPCVYQVAQYIGESDWDEVNARLASLLCDCCTA